MIPTWVTSTFARSQTESESNDDIILPEGYVTPYGSQNDATVSAPPLCKDNANELVIAATRFIEIIPDTEATDPEVHESIAEAVDYILAFIDALLSQQLVPDDHVSCIIELLSSSLMVRLFGLRAVFRELAAKDIYSSGSDVTIVSWADELLVKLCACILHLATDGAMQDTNKVSGIQSIKKLQENEARKSATQLPATFTELPGALLSKNVSPATSRMALTLLYGVYVLRTRYLKPPWEATPRGLTSNISKQVAKYATNETSPANIYPSVLTEYAMMVTLYAHCNNSMTIGTLFTPHSEHILLNLVDTIINYSSADNMCLGALKMILNDLGSMQWFWGRWGDGSTSIASTALRLTRSWILNSEPGSDRHSHARFDALWAVAPCSFQAILHLVEPPVPGASHDLGDSPADRAIIGEVCRAYTLLARNRVPGDQYEYVLAEACKRLCPYVLSLGEYGGLDTVWALVIEFAVAVGPGVLRTAYGDAATVEFRWSNRGLIEQVIQTVIGMINEGQDEIGGATPQAPKMRCLLDILVVFLHANTRAASAVIFSTTFMSTLITWGSKRPAFETDLRISTLLILGFLYSQFRVCCSVLKNRFPEFDLDGFIGTVLDNSDGSLLETGALARYMISTEEDRVLDDPVAVLEIWSRIQTTLLSTFQRRFVGDERALAVAVSGTLCAGLVSILNSVGKHTRAMILASPWTQTLRVELQRALEGTSVDDYSLGLRQQLKDVGMAVVRMIEGNPKPVLDDSVRLVYVDTGRRLEIVPLLFC